MEKWQPLAPTPAYGQQGNPVHKSAPRLDLYAPPAQSTRHAPPARPHPPTVASGKRRSLLPAWARGSQTGASQYASVLNRAGPKDTASPWEGGDAVPKAGNVGIFPLAIHRRIIDFLYLDDLARYMVLCHTLQEVASSESVWQSRAQLVAWRPVAGLTLSEPLSEERTSQSGSRNQIGAHKYGQARISEAEGRSSQWYEAVKSYFMSLRPFYRSLRESSIAPESSLVFTGPDTVDHNTWTAAEQVNLLSNLLRASLPYPCGAALFDLDDEEGRAYRPQTAVETVAAEAGTSYSRCLRTVLELLVEQLCSMFKAAFERRIDAQRAAHHGAAGTEGAIDRAEGDLRLLATSLWEMAANQHLLDACQGKARDGDRPAVSDTRNQDSSPQSPEWAMSFWLSRCSVLPRTDVNLENAFKENFIKHPTNETAVPSLNFTAMDSIMRAVVENFQSEGKVIARIFPPEQGVLLVWGAKMLEQLLSWYIKPLLDFARAYSAHLFLRCCAASFSQTLKLAEGLEELRPATILPSPSRHVMARNADASGILDSNSWTRRHEKFYQSFRCREMVYAVWGSVIEEYLKAETTWVLAEMNRVAEKFQSDLRNESEASRVDAAFLTAQNPAAVKRSVLSGFRDVLLLPATVVPRTAVNMGGAVFRTAGKGVSQLNPLNWQGGTSNLQAGEHKATRTGSLMNQPSHTSQSKTDQGYIDFSTGEGAETDMDIYDDDADGPYNSGEGDGAEMNPAAYVMNGSQTQDEWNEEVRAWKEVAQKATETSSAQIRHPNHRFESVGREFRKGNLSDPVSRPSSRGSIAAESLSQIQPGRASHKAQSSRSATPLTGAATSELITTKVSLQRMQLLLSLDTALQMIHLNRDSLKRVETFLPLAGVQGDHMRAGLEEIATLFLRCLGERHIVPGFLEATRQIRMWDPSQLPAQSSNNHLDTAQAHSHDQEHVEPLVHFFELVHVGDTISQMVQVYFDQELCRHVDKTDFLNPVVREKKRLESSLDESVAAGLNAGVDLLMNQAEHIITTRQDPRDFYPEQGQDLDLGRPTNACSEAVGCLQAHCKLLVGCADRNILEIFWQEIGIRLHAIVCKHLKRQIISLDGGFKVIADLNAYHAFIMTLKQPSLLPYFEALKMLGNVYIIENPRELAQLVRDASIFRGTLTPDDVYEFLQARCDFKAIEHSIDKEMYGFKISEDCRIM